MVTGKSEANSSAVKWRRKNPYYSRLMAKRLLSGPGSSKEIYHYEFDLGDSGITYSPGDGLAVIPVNNSLLVDALLERLNFVPDTVLPDRNITLREHMLTNLEIRTPSNALLSAVAEKAGNEELARLLETRDRQAIDAYLWSMDSLDILNLNPGVEFEMDEFLRLVRPLMHRTYSITSSPSVDAGCIHATVATVRYYSHHRAHGGVASTCLSDQVGVGEAVGIFIVPNRNFRLPENGDSPMIMIGPGTGIAPFISFLREREYHGSRGCNWLFFGDRNRSTDFIYKEEIEQMSGSGALHKLDLAFSRDQSEKIYVQHRMRENSSEFYDWLENGASVYVCGDAARMAPDVEEAIREIIMKHGNKSGDQATDYLETLRSEKRYLRDVY